MSDVLERIKAKYPEYASVPDDKLAVAIGDKYPDYLDRDPKFREEYTRSKYPGEARISAPDESMVKLTPTGLDASGAWRKFRETDWGKKLFGPTEAEKEAGVQPQPSLGEAASKAMEFTSMPPPARALLNKAIEVTPIEKFPIYGPEAKAVVQGAANVVENFPLMPLGGGKIAKTAMGVFAGEYALGLPEAQKQFKTALEKGDAPTALRVATETILGGALVGAGTVHTMRSMMAPRTAAELAATPKADEVPVAVEATQGAKELMAEPAPKPAPANDAELRHLMDNVEGAEKTIADKLAERYDAGERNVTLLQNMAQLTGREYNPLTETPADIGAPKKAVEDVTAGLKEEEKLQAEYVETRKALAENARNMGTEKDPVTAARLGVNARNLKLRVEQLEAQLKDVRSKIEKANAASPMTMDEREAHAKELGVAAPTPGEQNASGISQATEEDGNLRPPPVAGVREVPAQEGGGGVQPQAEGGLQPAQPTPSGGAKRIEFAPPDKVDADLILNMRKNGAIGKTEWDNYVGRLAPDATTDRERAEAIAQAYNNRPGSLGNVSPKIESFSRVTSAKNVIDIGGEPSETKTQKGQKVLTPKATVHLAAKLPPPGERPLGIVPAPLTSFMGSLRALAGQVSEPIKIKLRQFAMESLPKITASNRETGEAGVRLGASFQVARAHGELFAKKVLDGLDINPDHFGTALVEDNLRSVKEGYLREITQDTTPEKADELRNQADNVRSLIGADNSPFRTEADYQNFLARPDVQLAIDRHKQLWESHKDPLFREANDMDPDTPLATRGLQTGARINLKAITGEEPVRLNVGGTPSIVRQLATLKRRDPFAKRATGAGQSYEGNYNEIMAHGFEREMPVARQHEFIRKLIDSGDARVTDSSYAKDLTLNGETTQGFLLTLNPWRGKFLQVKKSLAQEYAAVSGLSESAKIPYFSKAAELFTRSSVVGLAEGTTHASNLMTEIFTGLGPTSNPLINALLKSAGRADLLYTLPKMIIKGFSNQSERMLDLATIGAAKEPYAGVVSKRLLNPIDQGVRLISEDIYKSMAEKGWVENTETAKREFINQVGNYNKRLQPKLIRMLRESGVQPFATAVHTFNVMGVRRLGLGSGARAGPNKWAGMALRADILGGYVGFAVVVTALNKLLSGSALGPQGTPLGAIGWTGDDNKTHYLDVGRLTGFTRGLRAVGAKGAIEARMQGLPPAEALRSGSQQVANTALAYLTGPAARFGFVAATGKSPNLPGVQVAKEAPPPGENLDVTKTQLFNNIVEATKEANPIIGTAADLYEGKPISEIAARQAMRYTPQTASKAKSSERFPTIVHSSNLHNYIEATIRDVRNAKPEDRGEVLNKALSQLENPADRQRAEREIKRRTKRQ